MFEPPFLSLTTRDGMFFHKDKLVSLDTVLEGVTSVHLSGDVGKVSFSKFDGITNLFVDAKANKQLILSFPRNIKNIYVNMNYLHSIIHHEDSTLFINHPFQLVNSKPFFNLAWIDNTHDYEKTVFDVFVKVNDLRLNTKQSTIARMSVAIIQETVYYINEQNEYQRWLPFTGLKQLSGVNHLYLSGNANAIRYILKYLSPSVSDLALFFSDQESNHPIIIPESVRTLFIENINNVNLEHLKIDSSTILYLNANHKYNIISEKFYTEKKNGTSMNVFGMFTRDGIPFSSTLSEKKLYNKVIITDELIDYYLRLEEKNQKIGSFIEKWLFDKICRNGPSDLRLSNVDVETVAKFVESTRIHLIKDGHDVIVTI